MLEIDALDAELLELLETRDGFLRRTGDPSVCAAFEERVRVSVRIVEPPKRKTRELADLRAVAADERGSHQREPQRRRGPADTSAPFEHPCAPLAHLVGARERRVVLIGKA